MTTIHNIHDSILEKIHTGAVRQKPKWYFVTLTLFIFFGLIALSLMLLYLVSFVALVLREHLVFEALSFGPRTLFAILNMLPLLLVILVIIVFFLLYILVRHFAFVYTKPAIVTLGGGLLVTLAIFGAVLFMDKNSRIARFGEGRHFPAIDILQSNFRDRMPPQLFHSKIIGVKTDGYSIEDTKGNVFFIHVNSRTRMDKSAYQIGDVVVILSVKKQNGLYAIGIRTDNDDTLRSFPAATSTP